MTGKRPRYSAEFKAKVALEALRGELTTAQLAAGLDHCLGECCICVPGLSPHVPPQFSKPLIYKGLETAQKGWIKITVQASRLGLTIIANFCHDGIGGSTWRP